MACQFWILGILEFYFKLYDFFLSYQASSSSEKGSGSVEGAVVPDGSGGFIIDDSVLDEAGHDHDSFSLPPLKSNGFIDFQNQFKVSRLQIKWYQSTEKDFKVSWFALCVEVDN